MRDRKRATLVAVIAVACLAAVVFVVAIIQAAHGYFRPLRPGDLAVIFVMLLLVTLMDLAPTNLPFGNFGSAFTVSGAVYVATTIGYGAIAGVIVALV